MDPVPPASDIALKRGVKPIYTAVNATAARVALDDLASDWGQRYPAVIRLWHNVWEEFIPFLDYNVEIPGDLHHAIESLNALYRRPIKARGHFPHRAGALRVPLPGARPVGDDGSSRSTLLPSPSATGTRRRDLDRTAGNTVRGTDPIVGVALHVLSWRAVRLWDVRNTISLASASVHLSGWLKGTLVDTLVGGTRSEARRSEAGRSEAGRSEAGRSEAGRSEAGGRRWGGRRQERSSGEVGGGEVGGGEVGGGEVGGGAGVGAGRGWKAREGWNWARLMPVRREQCQPWLRRENPTSWLDGWRLARS